VQIFSGAVVTDSAIFSDRNVKCQSHGGANKRNGPMVATAARESIYFNMRQRRCRRQLAELAEWVTS